MPTNCWNTDRMMPTQTIPWRPNRGPRSDTPLLFLSAAIACSRSFIVWFRSASGTRRAKMARASSYFPCEMRKRGDSGMVKASTP